MTPAPALSLRGGRCSEAPHDRRDGPRPERCGTGASKASRDRRAPLVTCPPAKRPGIPHARHAAGHTRTQQAGRLPSRAALDRTPDFGPDLPMMK